MRAALTDKVTNELGSALKSNNGLSTDADMSAAIKAYKKQARERKNPPKLPRSKPLDANVRSKYDRELNAIEDELDKLYSDPLSVWQKLLAEPDKYLSDDEIKEIDGDAELQ